MGLLDLCHKANLAIPHYKINIHNNHHNIDFAEKRKSKDKICNDNARDILLNQRKAKHIIINKLTL
jgi:hypothetical protein